MRDFSDDHSALALNTATLGHIFDGAGAGWTSEQVIDACAERGLGGITFWRREIGANAVAVGNRLRASGMQVCGLCRAPFLIGPLAPPNPQDMMDDFHSAIDMAADLGAPVLTILVGGVIEDTHSMTESLKRVTEIMGGVLSRAEQAGVILALEPLNPVYGGNRSCLVTTRDALAMCNALDSPMVKIAIDVWHVWWDTSLASELERSGNGKVAGYHLDDWLADTRDMLTDRGMMGDGVADLKAIRRAVEDTGYQGLCEVEILSANNWWKRDPNEVLDVMVERFRTVC